ncbi:MAG: GTPase, partial [Deltaproteobacteria bacterium]
MPTYNFKDRELTAKIVYYGPGMCGKTTNLQQVHAKMREDLRGKLVSIATETDRTIYFDLLPMNLGKIAGMTFTVRVFTVPGQIYYAETRRLVLQGADGVVFVADSAKDKLKENIESLKDLKKNLLANKLDYDTIPMVIQYNKRDLPGALPVAALDRALNERKVKTFEAVAMTGEGVLETLRGITVEVFNNVKRGMKEGRPAGGSAPAPAKAKGTAPAKARPQAPQAGAPQTAPAARKAAHVSGGALERRFHPHGLCGGHPAPVLPEIAG